MNVRYSRQMRAMLIRAFFEESDPLAHEVLRPLSHIRGNWELAWNEESKHFVPEEDSYAESLNCLIDEVGKARPPLKYHDNEDRLGEFVQDRLRWPVYRVGRRWVCDSYGGLLEQGGFDDIAQSNLLCAAAGRIWAALDRGQLHFDDMEKSHRRMLAAVLAVILYQRSK